MNKKIQRLVALVAVLFSAGVATSCIVQPHRPIVYDPNFHELDVSREEFYGYLNAFTINRVYWNMDALCALHKSNRQAIAQAKEIGRNPYTSVGPTSPNYIVNLLSKDHPFYGKHYSGYVANDKVYHNKTDYDVAVNIKSEYYGSYVGHFDVGSFPRVNIRYGEVLLDALPWFNVEAETCEYVVYDAKQFKLMYENR